MKELLIKALMPVIVQVIQEMLTADKLKGHAAKLFKMLKDFIVDSETKIDDKFLPLIQQVQDTFGIPDLPDN